MTQAEKDEIFDKMDEIQKQIDDIKDETQQQAEKLARVEDGRGQVIGKGKVSFKNHPQNDQAQIQFNESQEKQ